MLCDADGKPLSVHARHQGADLASAGLKDTEVRNFELQDLDDDA